MKNKRGISAVVATVLIILITVAAVTIVWTAIIPLINSQLEQGTACLDATQGISLANEGYTCKSTGTSEVWIQVKHGSKELDLRDIQVSFTVDGSSSSVSLRNLRMVMPGINGEKVYKISLDKIKETFGDSALTIDKIEEVSIAPIVGSGKTETTCGTTSTIELVNCG